MNKQYSYEFIEYCENHTLVNYRILNSKYIHCLRESDVLQLLNDTELLVGYSIISRVNCITSTENIHGDPLYTKKVMLCKFKRAPLYEKSITKSILNDFDMDMIDEETMKYIASVSALPFIANIDIYREYSVILGKEMEQQLDPSVMKSIMSKTKR